jgi:hypothetical protein
MDVEDSSETSEFCAVLMVYGGENFTLKFSSEVTKNICIMSLCELGSNN